MARNGSTPVIDSGRLRRLLDGVNAFGRLDGTGGFDRRALSDADMEARRWFAAQLEEAGLAVRWDGAGNLFGRFGEGDGPVVMAGSHLDTVPGGGAFDGALGVCVALESVRAMQEAGYMPAAPIEIVATSDGEGRFGGALGSGAIAGRIDDDWIEKAADADGVSLADAMTAQHLHPAAIADAALRPGSVKAFLEFCVEQGAVPEAPGETVAIGESVSGMCDWRVTLTGASGASGATPMDRRADAFAGLAEIAATIPSIIRIVGGDRSRVTVGKVDLSPNQPHSIPGKAVFSLDIREGSERAMRAVTAALRSLVERVARTRGLEAAIDETNRLAPVELDGALAGMLEEEAERLGLAHMRTASGVGYNARTMQGFCPAALVLVPGRIGTGDAPQGPIEWADVEKGAALYLAALTRFCDMPAREAPPSAMAAPVIAAPAVAAIAEAVSTPAPEEKAEDGGQGAGEEGEEDIDFDFNLDDIALEEDED